MTKKIKYKQLIRKLQRHAEDDVVMVAGVACVSFFTQDGMVCIARLCEYEDKNGNVKTEFWDAP